MLEAIACMLMLAFLAIAVYLWYPGININAPINSISEINPLQCWRFIVCSSVLSGTVLFLVFWSFSDARWIDLCLVSLGIGVLPGLLIGWLWQKIAHKTLSNYLKRVMLILTCFSATFFIWVLASGKLSEL